MNKFKKQFADADWTNPETYFQASQFLTEFDPAAAMSMSQKGIDLAKTLVPKAPKISDLSRKITESTGFAAGSPEHQTAMQEYMAKPSGTNVSVVIGDNGNVDPTKRTQQELQKSIMNAEKQRASLAKIAEDFDGSYLTYFGKTRGAFGSVMDKLGMKGRAVNYAADANAFKAKVRQLFNAYRKEITGAAAAVAELDRLEASFLNDKNLGPTSFATLLTNMDVAYGEGIEVMKTTYREGFNIEPEVVVGATVATSLYDLDLSTATDAEITRAYDALLKEGDLE
jgi:hypothetical protein